MEHECAAPNVLKRDLTQGENLATTKKGLLRMVQVGRFYQTLVVEACQNETRKWLMRVFAQLTPCHTCLRTRFKSLQK